MIEINAKYGDYTERHIGFRLDDFVNAIYLKPHEYKVQEIVWRNSGLMESESPGTFLLQLTQRRLLLPL